jgi:hypothetical protein
MVKSTTGTVMDIMPENRTLILTILAVILCVGILISHSLRIKVDLREPPVVYPKVPFIGHIIGMVREGPLYLRRLGYVRIRYTLMDEYLS